MPNINTDILIWARESAGLSLEDAAAKLQLRDSTKSTAAEKLLAYEEGKVPSRPMLVKMAKQYRKPLLTFYMDRPPVRGDRGEDFRTLPEGEAPEENYLVDVLIRDIKARQSVLRETLIDEDEAEPRPFIGQADIGQGMDNVSRSIIQALEFDLDQFRACKTTDDAFKYLRTKAEDLGIYVLLVGNLGSYHSNIDTKVFRGFVLSDEFAPFIVINDLDSKAAWCFTLLHEIAHLWLGQTGVSGAFAENRIEKFCNDVASEILLPADELAGFVPDTQNFEDLAQMISEFSKARNISSHLVSYRLHRQGNFDQQLWYQLSAYFRTQWQNYKAAQRERNRNQDGGPSYYVVRRNKLGDAMVRFAERMTSSGALTTTKAGLLLDVKSLNVHKLFDAGRAI